MAPLLLCSSLSASTLHLALSASPSRLNPLLATDSASGEISSLLFNSLITYDENGSYRCEMAASYRFVSPTRLRFVLRAGMHWHDGKVITAEDVRFTWKLATSPTLFSPYSEEFRFVKEVRVLGPLEVEVEYARPYFKALELWMMPILPAHALSLAADPMTSPFNRAPVGSGAWKIATYEPTRMVRLSAFSGYMPKPPGISEVAYHIVFDDSAQMLMLRKGELDIGELSPLQLERQIDADFTKRYAIYEQPGNSYVYLGFNLTLPKFRDPRVRRALSLAIDRQQLVDLLLFGHGQVSRGPFLPSSLADNPTVKAPVRDLAQARALLAQAGYGPGRPLTFEIATSSSNSTRLYAAQIMQQQLQEVGVEVKIRAMEWQAFLQTVVMPRRFETVLLGWSMPIFPDAYGLWHSESRRKGGFNFIGYANPVVDRLIKEAETTVERGRLGVIHRELYTRIAADDPYLFLYVPTSITAINRSIGPIRPSLIGLRHNITEWIKP